MPKKSSSHLKQGSEFEGQMRRICDAYRVQGRADFEKVDPPSVRTRWATIYKNNPFLDFLGVWTERGGRTIFIEAKTTKVPYLFLNEEANSGITPDQVTSLARWEVAGAAVGCIWRHDDELRFVTLNQIYAAKAEETASVKWKNAYQIPEGVDGVTHDFLAVLHVLYPCNAH